MRYFVITMAAMFLLAGCVSTSIKTKKEDVQRTIPVVLLNKDLSRTLVVDPKVLEERSEDGYLFIQVKLSNQTAGEILHIQIQTIWKDAKNNPIDEEGPWQTMVLTPGQSGVYNQTSPTPSAVFYTVRVRYFVPQLSS